MTKVQTIALKKTLRPQIEALYTPVLAATPAAQGVFSIKRRKMKKPRKRCQNYEPSADERHLNFLVYWDNDETSQQLIGFTRISEEPMLSALVGSPLIVDLSLSQQQQEAVQRALFAVSQAAGETLVQNLLVETRAKTELEGDVKNPVPESSAFWRSMFAATEFTKTLLVENGFSDTNARLEMSMDLSKIASGEAQDSVTFPEDIQVKHIDVSDPKFLLAAYDVIKMAFGPSPPSFEAWKIHYAAQPRFAPS